MSDCALPSYRAERVAGLDGLRGIAAVIVVIFHYLCLLHPDLVPSMGVSLLPVVDTPLHLLWNGRFAVEVFFVLSGYVIATAADRRKATLLENCVSRYLRLSLPVAASCLVAWIWLTAFPDAAQTMQKTIDEPSRFLKHTFQDPILPVWFALADGAVTNFISGYSRFNNVLWTMQIELIGSISLFLLYSFCHSRFIPAVLFVAATTIIVYLPGSYLAFVVGAGLYEAHKRFVLQRLPAILPVLAFATAILLGAPGEGAHERFNLPLSTPEHWKLGQPRGLISIFAAGMMVYAVLMHRVIAEILSAKVPLFLGRISFGLYLVHVPPLYTIVTWSMVQGVPEYMVAIGYAGLTMILAYAFTLFVDEPILRRLSFLRAKHGIGFKKGHNLRTA